jgi:DNA-binding transcriptional MerR regulator
MQAAMKVGALARRTGLTVRTLHHYDEIGLLSPSHRTRSGHRLYGEHELSRLQQIASLKHLGLPLEEIRACLVRPEYSLEHVLDLQIERIEEQIRRHERLRGLIEALRDQIASGQIVSVDDFARTVEVTVNYAKYYSPTQLAELDRCRAEVGKDRIHQVQREWSRLLAEYGRAMEEGLSPDHESVRVLAVQSAALVAEFTGGDPAMKESLDAFYDGEGAENVMAGHGMEMAPGLWQYMAEAQAALGRS